MYTNNHRYFLQFMLRNSYVSIQRALEVCKNFPDLNIDDLDALKTFTSEINEKILEQDLKLVVAKCEVTGGDNLTLLNLANDDITKLQNALTPIELEYFQILLKEVIISDDHRLSSMACVNFSDSVTSGNLAKVNAEKLLAKWTRGGYFAKKDSYVHMGQRCILEFAPYFQVHCKDYYTSCNLCSEPVFTGQTCLSCSDMMHSHCLDNYLRKQSKCPRCKVTWNEVSQKHAGHVLMQLGNSSGDEEEISFRSTSRKSRRLM